MRSIQITLTIILSALALTSFANHSPGVTVFPQVGITTYSGASEIGVDPNYGLGVGYQFTSPWAIELTYLKGSSSVNDGTQNNLDIYQWHLNGLYHFYKSEKIRPYITFGIGEADFNFTNDPANTERQTNVGVGIKWQGWRNTDFRTGFKVYNGHEDELVRSTFNVGIHHVITNSTKPNSRPSSRVAATGISDSDGDGVANSKDQCPNSPSGQIVNKVGCLAEQDRDRDGVTDANDKCPGTTNAKNVIDAQGCYITTRQPVELNVLFQFDFDSSATKPEHINEAEKIATFAKTHSGASVALSGHTDDIGASAYNQALSQARVSAVAKLVEMNTRITKSRISLKSYGETKPKKKGADIASRRANRRVEGTVKAVAETQKKK